MKIIAICDPKDDREFITYMKSAGPVPDIELDRDTTLIVLRFKGSHLHDGLLDSIGDWIND